MVEIIELENLLDRINSFYFSFSYGYRFIGLLMKGLLILFCIEVKKE